MSETFENSPLEKWLRKEKITTKHFTDLVGCSRPTVWKVKLGLAISSKIADKIALVTLGAIKPHVSEPGKPKGSKLFKKRPSKQSLVLEWPI